MAEYLEVSQGFLNPKLLAQKILKVGVREFFKKKSLRNFRKKITTLAMILRKILTQDTFFKKKITTGKSW